MFVYWLRNKVLATALAILITIGSTMPVFAIPSDTQLSESRQKYAEIENKIKDIQEKLNLLN